MVRQVLSEESGGGLLRVIASRVLMALRELTEAEWQHSFVPVLRLAGPGSSTPSGDADPRSREHAVGDVKHVMVRSRDAATRYTMLYRRGIEFCVLESVRICFLPR